MTQCRLCGGDTKEETVGQVTPYGDRSVTISHCLKCNNIDIDKTKMMEYYIRLNQSIDNIRSEVMKRKMRRGNVPGPRAKTLERDKNVLWPRFDNMDSPQLVAKALKLNLQGTVNPSFERWTESRSHTNARMHPKDAIRSVANRSALQTISTDETTTPNTKAGHKINQIFSGIETILECKNDSVDSLAQVSSGKLLLTSIKPTISHNLNRLNIDIFNLTIDDLARLPIELQDHLIGYARGLIEIKTITI